MKNLTHEQASELLGKSLDEIKDFIKSHSDKPQLPAWVAYKYRKSDHKNIQDKIQEIRKDIDSTFSWEDTPQGHEYWDKVYQNLNGLSKQLDV